MHAKSNLRITSQSKSRFKRSQKMNKDLMQKRTTERLVTDSKDNALSSSNDFKFEKQVNMFVSPRSTQSAEREPAPK